MAKNYQLAADDLLISLWFDSSLTNKFNYLSDVGSVIKIKDLNLVKNIAVKKHPPVQQVQKISKQLEYVIKRPVYNFNSFGKQVDNKLFLNTNEVLAINDVLTKDFATSPDPISPVGVRDMNLLESALLHQKTSFDGRYKYPTVESSAAALMYALSNNHPFHNGNKRTALVSLLVYLERYNVGLTCNDGELFKTSLSLAEHKIDTAGSGIHDAEVYLLSKWIYDNEKPMKKGERVITFRKLKQILTDHGCNYDSRRGRFERKIPKKLGGYKQIFFRMPSDSIQPGEEVDKGVINTLRKQFQLDNNSGFDADAFYSGAEYSAGEFINKYRGVLKRLSHY